MIEKHIIDAENEKRIKGLQADFDALGEHLDRRGISIDSVRAGWPNPCHVAGLNAALKTADPVSNM